MVLFQKLGTRMVYDLIPGQAIILRRIFLMSEQKIYYYNCPHCGEINEAVSPKTDRTIKGVNTFELGAFFISSDPQLGTTSWTACKRCREKIKLYWEY